MAKPSQFHRAVERYLAGEGSAPLASAYGVTPGTMRRWLRSAGVEIRPKGSDPKLPLNKRLEAKHMAAQGLKREYIAAVMGVCLTTLRGYLKREELE